MKARGKSNVDVLTGFDGSSPHSARGVKWETTGRVVLYPNLRRVAGVGEEAPGGGSRFSTRLLNRSRKPVNLSVIADWEARGRMGEHDYGYIRHEKADEWAMVPGLHAGGARIEYRLVLPPGMTHLGLYPEFNLGDLNALVRRSRRRGCKVDALGRSREGRELWLLTVPAVCVGAQPFFIEARDHAYETAGSYCAAGIVDFLTGNSPLAAYLRTKFTVMVVPMSNPDGVFNGLSRLTWEKGADMCRVHTAPDPGHAALRAALDRVRPAVYMNIHNWTYKFTDGLMPLESSLAERILVHMPADSLHFKRWKVRTLADDYKRMGLDSLSPAEARKRHRKNWLWKHYLNYKYGTVCAAFEFPWFGLNTSEMRAKGARAFIATALAAIEEKNW